VSKSKTDKKQQRSFLKLHKMLSDSEQQRGLDRPRKALPAQPAAKLEPKPKAGAKEQSAPKGEAALTVAEELKLEQYENVIKQGLGGFMLVGKALTAIRDEKLYRAKFETFDDYCGQQWGMGKQYAYRLIEAYTMTETLKSELQKSPIGDNRLPTNESQVRPLGPLEPKQRIKAWRQVLKNCEGKPITADEVEAVVGKMGGNTPTAQTTGPKTELKKANTKLTKIGKWVTETLDEDESKLTVTKLKQILEKIRDLIGTKK